MIREEAFWNEEGKSAILQLNAGFVRHDNADELIDRVRSWVDLVEKNGKREVTMIDSCPDPSNDRIFKLDAVRTFISKERQADMVKTLASIWYEMKDYSQGMGYMVAVLSLFLTPEEVVRVCLTCDTDPKYIPGYWRLGPVAFQHDARVYQRLFNHHYPELAKHIKFYTVAEAYAQKYLCGMNIHVLPYKYLFDYLEGFFTHGHEYAFRFTMALLKVLEPQLMASENTDTIMALLRLDKEKFPPVNPKDGEEDDSIFAKIMAEVPKIELGLDIEETRKAVAIEIAEELERKKKREAELAALLVESESEIWSDEE